VNNHSHGGSRHRANNACPNSSEKHHMV
jgi:hypothetical protein